MTVALITGSDMPREDWEQAMVLEALTRLEVAADIQRWRDPLVDWDAYELLVLKSPWDYSHHHEAFVAWVQARAATLENPAEVVSWTTHKRYLCELEHAGVPTVPTVLLEGGASPEAIRAAAGAAGQGQASYDVIVKPAVAAGGRGMTRVGDPESAAAHAGRLLLSGDVILQPFQPEVLTGGETSLVFFGGHYSHAVRKRATGAEYRIHEHYGGTVEPHSPSDAEIRVAGAAIACAPEPTLYARVDLIGAGEPRVGELELVEPELFLRYDAQAADRFASAIAARLA